MRLKPEQLAASLGKGLLPVYLLVGDEPLQLLEMADAIRAQARGAGYLARTVLAADAPGFDWRQLTEAATTLSLFADRTLVDLRLGGDGPGADGGKALVGYCQRPPADTLLLVSLGKAGQAVYGSRWFQAIDKAGAVCQAWPLQGAQLSAWLQQRLRRRGLDISPEGLRLMAGRVEGNLLAAAQEVEKLYVLYGEGRLDERQIADAIAHSSRFTVFDLVAACLAAEAARSLGILKALLGEGVAVPIVVWALAREIRQLGPLKWRLGRGQAATGGQAADRHRQRLLAAAARLSVAQLDGLLALAARADRQSKGQQAGDAAITLQQLCLLFAGAPTTAPAALT